jgi:outer membrane protein
MFVRIGRSLTVVMVIIGTVGARATVATATDPLTGVVAVEECVTVALREHPAIAAAGARVDASQQRVNQARSGFLPHIDGTYGIKRQDQSIGSLIGVPTVGGTALGICRGGTTAGGVCRTNGECPGGFCFFQAPPSSETTFTRSGFSLDQLIFDFGKQMFEMRAAQSAKLAVAASRDAVEQDIVLNVRRAYYNLIAAHRLQVVAEETEAQTRRQLDEARGRYEVGSAPKFDVTQQEVQVADAELARLRARNAVALGRETLREAMGLDDPIEFEPNDHTLDAQRREVDEALIVDRAYSQRPELIDVRARIRSERQRMASVKTDYLPSVRGFGEYDWTGEDRPEEESWVVGANITLSIFNGGQTTAELGERRAEIVGLEADERKEKHRVALEVRQAILNIREAEDSIRVSEKQVGQARESLEIAEGRYSAGVGNIIELTDAQVDLSRARANLVRTLANYWIFVAQLGRAMGDPVKPPV